MEEGKRKYLITVTAIVLFLFTLSLGAAKEAEAKDSIYVSIGLGMNYSVVNQNVFLEPKLGLEFLFTEKIMADISFGFETHSTDYSGIQKLEQKYFAIDLLGKYFLLEGIYLDPSVLIRLGLPTEEADSFDLTVGLYFTIAFGIVRK